MLSFQVKDVGPIKSAEFDLKPLTVITGPNSSGKSYLALIVNTFINVLNRHGIDFRQFPDEVAHYEGLLAYRVVLSSGHEPVKHLASAEPMPSLEQLVDEQLPVMNRALGSVHEALSEELERCFGCPVHELKRTTNSRSTIGISGQSLGQLVFKLSKSGLNAVQDQSVLGLVTVASPDRNGRTMVLSKLFGWVGLARSLYFPAARTGLLQVHKAVAGMVMRRYGLRQVDTNPLVSGVVADFIGELVDLASRGTLGRAQTSIAAIGEFLETEILRGSVEQSREGFGEVLYQRGKRALPVPRVSSMIAELAPVVLFLKYSVQAEQLVIVEEPEAHLHPENQRIFARALAQLVNAGVHVMVITHSDFFVQQLGNCVQASTLPFEKAAELGISSQEVLQPEQVGVYTTRLDADGYSTLHELHASPDEGIPEESFASVAVELSNQSAKLDWAHH